MIPDSLYGPLFIAAGAALLGLDLMGQRRGRVQSAYTRYGKLVFAVLMMAFGLLLIMAARGSR